MKFKTSDGLELYYEKHGEGFPCIYLHGGPEDFTTLTNEINKPVLVIAGEYDDAVSPNHHRLFKFKNSEVRVLKSAHHPYIENQLEFKDAIIKFVNG